MFDMATDSNLFRTRELLEGEGFALEGNVFRKVDRTVLPLYEAKMAHHYDHRFGDYAMKRADYGKSDLPEVPLELLSDPRYTPMPRYWVDEQAVRLRLAGRWQRDWLIGWRDVTNTVNERTVIAAVLPLVAVGHTFPLIVTDASPELMSALVAVLDSFLLDYVARQKVGGMHLTYGFLTQFPVAPPAFLEPHVSFLTPRVLELTYTADNLAGFARDLGFVGRPFGWEAKRRELIRAELDAFVFLRYGLDRADVDYVLDTFPLVRRGEERLCGEYRTKRYILDRYDAMSSAEAAGQKYQTPLEPPPGEQQASERARGQVFAA
jgi:hypothetical protein